MKFFIVACVLASLAFVQCQISPCLSDPNPVTACTAVEILDYLRTRDLNACYSLTILTDNGASCDDLDSVMQTTLTTLDSGDCLPASVSATDSDSETSGAAATGDAEDDAVDEDISEPHQTPGEPEITEVTQSPEEPNDAECYTQSDGGDYFGDVSVTENGLECQSWAVSTPHRPIKKYNAGRRNIIHPQHFGPHNHCRTLGFMENRVTQEDQNNYSGRSGPWCYTMDQNTRWEYCDVGESSASCSSTG